MISIKKALFVFCMALGLSGSIANATAGLYTQAQCDALETKCQNGVPRACELLARHCP
ncbi:hypothetical protein ACFDR9_002063 [Janthinobacterium sp. CG_23.3]|uniref:hypothetical protein n=1 Tax=unclassified Janthinobacterium TaxID=2610881 RepID=UPI00034A92D4|nr:MULTISPECIES: hypothetical protein [unclassified Janthinobacterium]MEC5159778.1 hypothetical protein [Janthinobacterium sp. CG_S6]